MCKVCGNGEHKTAYNRGGEWAKQNSYPVSKPIENIRGGKK